MKRGRSGEDDQRVKPLPHQMKDPEPEPEAGLRPREPDPEQKSCGWRRQAGWARVCQRAP